jgi:hypothetical protein
LAAPDRLGALERCASDGATFFERYWGRTPLLTQGGAGAFDDLASLEDLDHMISSLGLGASRLRMVKAGKTLAASEYTSPPKGARAVERTVSSPAVYANYEDGATIVLESLHRYWRPLTDFCRELELDLGHRLQVNSYITPPGSQGFEVHRDSHDVFVLQIAGSKHWMVYDRDDEDHILIDQPLEPGASLYIPEGFPHAAKTGETMSAHLTVGVLTHKASVVVQELAKLAESEPIFTERLPMELADNEFALRAVVEGQIEELQAWLDKVDVDELTGRVARRVMTSAQPLTRGQLTQLARLEDLGASSLVARRPGASCLLFPGHPYLKVLLADRELRMPASVQRAMERVAVKQGAFAVQDLHEYLTPEGALVLVRRLVREGFLEVVLDA